MCRSYNLSLIRTPTFEERALFSLTIGQESDVTNKELYTFKDKAGRELALRPEGTAAAVRAIVENKLLSSRDRGRFAYFGRMFRYEQPQSGRFREFYQAGVEFVSPTEESYMDFEVIQLADRLLKGVGVSSYKLKLNYLGNREERERYKEGLKSFFQENNHLLDERAREKIDRNPLRVLDDNSERGRRLKDAVPGIVE